LSIEAENDDKENLDIKIHLARNYLSLEKPIWAERSLKRLLKVNPDHEEGKELFKQCIKARV